MAPKEIDEVEDRIAELQSRLDDLQSTLGRLHETIDLIEPQDGAEIDLDAAARRDADVIDLRTTQDIDS
jgi:chromosome segregation ATPase